MDDGGAPVKPAPDPKVCGECGGPLVEGYGLCGGGIGTYWMCNGEGPCDFFFKRMDPDYIRDLMILPQEKRWSPYP